MNEQDRLERLLDAGSAAAAPLDAARVLASARGRRSRRRGALAALAAGAAAVVVVLAVTTGGARPDDAAPVAPSPTSSTERPRPSLVPSPAPTTSPPADFLGPRYVLVNGSVCDGEIVCFQVLDQAAPSIDGMFCAVGPREVGPTPAPTPDVALADGTKVQVLGPDSDQLQGYVGDRFFVLHGIGAVGEAEYLEAAVVCAQAPPLEQVRSWTLVWTPDVPYPPRQQQADAALLQRLVAFAADPAVDAASVPLSPEVLAGSPQLVLPVRDVADRAGWPVPESGSVDRASVIELLARFAPTADPTRWTTSDGRAWRMQGTVAPDCPAASLATQPAAMAGFRAIGLVSAGHTSCLDAGALTVYVDEQERVAGVVQGVWEP